MTEDSPLITSIIHEVSKDKKSSLPKIIERLSDIESGKVEELFVGTWELKELSQKAISFSMKKTGLDNLKVGCFK
ncbi:hypothetical protein EON64_05665 [archaeon]|nr:MAG: hypothetical protein EON64_05665 [archaeon]